MQHLDFLYKSIHVKYANYVDRIQTIVKEKGISARTLRSYLANLPAFAAASDKKKLNSRSRLCEDDTIESVFEVVAGYSSFLEFDVFQTILEKYGSDEEHEDLKYPEHLKEYITMIKLDELAEHRPHLINPELLDDSTTEIKIKYDLDCEHTPNLESLKKVKIAIAKILGVNASLIRIYRIEEGCVVVTLLISSSIADDVFNENTTFSPEQKHLFRKASVLWLECNGLKFYFSDNSNSEQLEDNTGMS